MPPVAVACLAGHVLAPHVADASQAEAGADRGPRHAVLTGPGLGDDPPLAHAPGEQHLPQRVVDLVGPGVAEVLALEPDLSALGRLGQALRVIERRGPSGEGAGKAFQLGAELPVALAPREGLD